jgi:hypothetical protein
VSLAISLIKYDIICRHLTTEDFDAEVVHLYATTHKLRVILLYILLHERAEPHDGSSERKHYDRGQRY